MLNDVPRGTDIGEATHRLLLRADAYGRWPTAVGDIVAAAGLIEPRHSMLSDLVLEQAPAHLRRAIRKLRGKVRALLDRREREIHIDPDARTAGHISYLKLHEVTHDICDWQKEPAYADDDHHLSPAVRKIFEWQANCGAAELLFQRGQFTAIARDYAISMAAVLDLSQTVGASAHATMRRFVECHDAAVAGVVMELSPCSISPLGYRRYEVVHSRAWQQRFGVACWPRVLYRQPYGFVTTANHARASGVPMRSQFTLPDLNNQPVQLNAEVYCNYYRLLALIWVPRRETLRRRRIIVPSLTSAHGA
jgi:hypothetical protein